MRYCLLLIVLTSTCFTVFAADTTLHVWVAPDTCKVNPRNGNILEEHYWNWTSALAAEFSNEFIKRLNGKALPYFAADSYDGPTAGKLRAHNPVWDEPTNTVSLRAARGECTAFQVVVENAGDGPVSKATIEVSALNGPAAFDGSKASLYREHYMQMSSMAMEKAKMSTQTGKKAWFPEILVPVALKDQLPFDIPDKSFSIEGQRNQALWIDVNVPAGQAPGEYSGKIKVSAENARTVELKLRLEVVPLTLPAKQTFNLDMMDYGALGKAFGLKTKTSEDCEHYLQVERQAYRLFHEHRASLDIIHGSASTRDEPPAKVCPPGIFAPKIEGAGESIHVADWTEYDRHYGPYFSGEAFKDLPRSGEPLSFHFLPFAAGWPASLSQYFSNRKLYETEFKKVLQDFEKHFTEKGWDQTEFLIYFNGKKKFGEPWDTDEPMSKEDYAALREFGTIIREALGPRAQRKANIQFRVDIGTPSRMKGELDDVLDIRNVNYEYQAEQGFFWSDYRNAQEHKGEQWWYYAMDREHERWTRIDWSMAANYLWGWELWDLNVRTACLWEALGWDQKDPLHMPGNEWGYVAMAYPGTQFGFNGLVPSMKLKGIRRGLEDAEYLQLLASKDGDTRRANAILLKYYTTRDRDTGKVKDSDAVRVGPEDPYKLRADILSALNTPKAATQN